MPTDTTHANQPSGDTPGNDDARRAPNGAPRVAVHLVGEDGNAFAIIGRTLRAMRRAGWSQADRMRYTSEATSGDYNHLLAVTLDYTYDPRDDGDDLNDPGDDA